MNNFSDWIDKHADFVPDKVAIHFEGRTITYAQFSATVQNYARTLKNTYGIDYGDRLAYLGFNTPEYLFTLFACARIGVIFSPLNWRLTAPELVYILADSAPKVVVCDTEHRAAGEAIREDLSECEFIAVDFEAKGWLNFQADLQTSEGVDNSPDVSGETPQLLVYTSGTTGRSKGALLTQEAMLINALNGVHLADMNSLDNVLTCLPMFHVGGLNIQTVPAFYVGATVILHRRFDPVAVLRDLQNFPITLTCLVPATCQAIINQPDWLDARFPALKSVLMGSSIVPYHLINAFHEKRVPVGQMYGSTETAPIALAVATSYPISLQNVRF